MHEYVISLNIGEMKMNLKGRSFLTLKDYSKDEIIYLVKLAAELKKKKKGKPVDPGVHGHLLAGKNIVLLFDKTSTRTRCSFEVAAYDEGAGVTFLTNSQMGKKESLEDTAKVLGRMYDGIEYRGFEHSIVEDLAAFSGVPVWNGLTDDDHPTQVLADFLTAYEHLGKPFEEMKLGRREQTRSKTANFLELYTVLSVGFILLATEVYHVFADNRYWQSTLLIPIFVSNYYLNFLCTFPVNYEYYQKKTKVVAVVTAVSCGLNIVLNYIFIRRVGMAGAAAATLLSHMLQLALHYGYTRYFLGKQDYPFGVRLWWKYALAYAAAVALVYLTQDVWPLRWGLSAVIGVWELLRLKKRKVLI